jgi:hypothetical protein
MVALGMLGIAPLMPYAHHECMMVSTNTWHSARQGCAKTPLVNMTDLADKLADAWGDLSVDTPVVDYMG